MTAYLGTGAVREFIVPGTPPADMAVASNFERFDGLGEPPLDNAPAAVPFGTAYPGSPRPGQLNTPPDEQVYTRSPNSGLVGVLGGQPLPVGNRLPPAANAEGQVTLASRRVVGGPKLVLGSQHNPSLAATVYMSEITSSPPQPGDMTSILAGLS